jgi:hypothetical protein
VGFHRFNIVAIAADFYSLHNQLTPLSGFGFPQTHKRRFPIQPNITVRSIIAFGCDRNATVDKFVTPAPRIIGCILGLTATSPNTTSQFEFFDNTLKNKPDHCNRMGYRKSSNPKQRIRLAAVDARVELCLPRGLCAASFR